MKLVKFRPLRRVKKSGKIVVASYMQWRKVMTADYGKFKLIVNDEYKRFADSEYVYNHEGEQLFFKDYNMADVPVFTYNVLMDLDAIRAEHKQYGIDWGGGSGHVNYITECTDCDGIPTFSHLTADRAADYRDVEPFVPLTVGIVKRWFGWFLWQLNNSDLKIGN